MYLYQLPCTFNCSGKAVGDPGQLTHPAFALPPFLLCQNKCGREREMSIELCTAQERRQILCHDSISIILTLCLSIHLLRRSHTVEYRRLLRQAKIIVILT